MKRIATWLLSTITVVVLLFGYHTSTSGKATSAPEVIGSANPATNSGAGATSSEPTNAPTSDPAGPTPTASPSPGSVGTPQPSSTASPSPTAATVQGDVADTQWGPVQVQVIVANGKITDVSVLQYPNGNGKDQQINAYALPVLINETLAKQSAAIDMVSGATVTSDGYTRSLQSALDKAGL
ncbi:FMN-binding protein [Kribbella monticola]|uniref:FMN-binding protein n=1 Tax=Kribbella monticola TaxID=2185285 RepID=UPI000DD4BA7C|nr:FMN-binding protein [Kribbella monticola]